MLLARPLLSGHGLESAPLPEEMASMPWRTTRCLIHGDGVTGHRRGHAAEAGRAAGQHESAATTPAALRDDSLA